MKNISGKYVGLIALLILIVVTTYMRHHYLQKEYDVITESYQELYNIRVDLKEENQKLLKTAEQTSKTNKQLNEELKKSHQDVKQLKKEIKKLKKELKKEKNKVATKGKTLIMEATAYTAYCTGCSGTTRTGINLRKYPDRKVVAVDPKVIPLGTKLYVEGYGKAVAGDTGGDIKNNRIDVFIPSKPEALDWGRKQVKVTILN